MDLWARCAETPPREKILKNSGTALAKINGTPRKPEEINSFMDKEPHDWWYMSMAVGVASTFRFGLLRLRALEQPMILKGLGPRVLQILSGRVVRRGRDQRSSAHLRALAEVGAHPVSIWSYGRV